MTWSKSLIDFGPRGTPVSECILFVVSQINPQREKCSVYFWKLSKECLNSSYLRVHTKYCLSSDAVIYVSHLQEIF